MTTPILCNQPHAGDKIVYFLLLYQNGRHRFALCRDHHASHQEAVACLQAKGITGEGVYIKRVEEVLIYITAHQQDFTIDRQAKTLDYAHGFIELINTFRDASNLNLVDIRTLLKAEQAERKARKQEVSK